MNASDPIADALTALIAAIREQVRAEMPAHVPVPNQVDGPQLLTLVEARERLRVSKATVDRMVRSGRMRKVKIGSRTFIPADEVERFISESTAG